MKIRCIITDDEPMARKGLEGYVKKLPLLELAGVCEDAMQLNALLKTTAADLLFLDIEMPYMSGIDWIKTVQQPPKVVLTTAYENYALQGYELDVLDYLLKPVSFERFVKAAHKAADYFNSIREKDPEFIFIKVDGRLEKILFKEIIFIRALENYVAIQTYTKKWITHATLRSVTEKLPAGFIQTHKSWVVNSACISSLQGNRIFCGPHEIPISKYLKEEVMQIITRGHVLK